jgi:single-stranded DNA-binding protein
MYKIRVFLIVQQKSHLCGSIRIQVFFHYVTAVALRHVMTTLRFKKGSEGSQGKPNNCSIFNRRTAEESGTSVEKASLVHVNKMKHTSNTE